MRDAWMMRKMEMLLGENGRGCVVAIVIYPTRATGVFPRPPYSMPHVRRALSVLSFSVVSVSLLSVSVVSVSVFTCYPEPEPKDLIKANNTPCIP